MAENGKKANGLMVPGFMVAVLILSLVGYGEVKGRGLNNEKNISDLKATPVQIGKLETKVDGLAEDIGEVKDFMHEQRSLTVKILAKLQ